MVKRYELCFYEGIAASDSGSFVLYDDYATLEKQLAELQDKLRWRDVREELPDANASGDFLVFVEDGKLKYNGVYSFGLDGKDKWQYLGVTHWLPLPDAPCKHIK